MASKDYLSLLIGVTIILLVVSFFLYPKNQVEGFATQRSYSVNDLEISACPTYTNEIQTAKGKTDCCTGELIDGKCNAKTFCTKSPKYDNVPTCIEAWRQYFRKKGIDFCPATMPNYFEDVRNPQAMKGCSASSIVKDGKTFTDGTKKRCQIYATEALNKSKSDSCYLEKERLKIQCPVVNGRSPEAMMMLNVVNKNFNYFYCQYPFEIGMPDRCYDKKTVMAFQDAVNPNWRMQSNALAQVNDDTCDNYIAKRQRIRAELDRLAEERRRREAAEAKYRALWSRFQSFFSRFKRQESNNNRLQQQLDDANRRAQQCKK